MFAVFLWVEAVAATALSALRAAGGGAGHKKDMENGSVLPYLHKGQGVLFLGFTAL
jgi:hypothetical protein